MNQEFLPAIGLTVLDGKSHHDWFQWGMCGVKVNQQRVLRTASTAIILRFSAVSFCSIRSAREIRWRQRETRMCSASI